MLAAFALLALLPRPVSAYVEAPYTLGRICTESTNILIVRVETVDREKNTIIYRKVRDLKGTHPGETIKHNIAHNGFQPREWQNVMQWAEVGQIAVIFHNGGASETCINGYWYQAYAGDWWSMSHAEPYLLRSYCGKPEKCAAAVELLLAGQETTVPCMVDGDKEALQRKAARLQRLKASLKIQDYVPERDFAGWGVEEFRPISGMPGFTHIAALPSVGPGTIGVTPLDFDGDGKIDLLIYGANRVSLLQNAGGSLNEIQLPAAGTAPLGARAAAWADYNGDKKPDLLLATTSGPKLFTNLGDAKFKDDTVGLPTQDYYNLTAAAWIDYDGDGKPDILLADGFRGLRLYRNLGSPTSVPLNITMTKWQQCGPFDNTGNQGYAAVYPPENSIDLKGEYPGKNKQKAAWREVEFPDATLNSVKLYREEDHTFMTIYLYRQITTNKAVEVPISLGGGGPLACWINGVKVISHDVQHQPAPDQAQAVLKLKPGKNDLLVKACFVEHGRSAYVKASPPTEGTPPLFEDVSDKVGLGTSSSAFQKGDGLLVADVNGDGRPDILYVAGNGVLLLNTPTGFVEAKDSGLSFHAGKVTPLFGDFFGDKRAHLLVPQHDGVKLFRNDGKGHFSDVTSQSGDLATLKCDASSAAVGDFTGKGRADILIGCIRGTNHLLRNNGNGTFTDISEEVGLDQRVFNTRATAVLDFNRDGAPDAVFINEGQESALLLGKVRQTVAIADPPAESPVTVASSVPTSNPAGGAVIPPQAVAAVTPVQESAMFPSMVALLSVGSVAVLIAIVSLMVPWRARRGRKLPLILLALLMFPAASQADWLTSRGNPAHTGTDDNLPGPRQPKVRWVYKAREHFIASPVPTARVLYVSGLGAFNDSAFHALALNGDAPERVIWSKDASAGTKFIPLPIVSSPAVVDGLLIFGDGMHQTDGATLYCFNADTGRPIWQYPFPGRLVHMEGAPTVSNGHVFVGGGNAGVICIDINQITLDGNVLTAEAVRFMMDKKWTEMLAKYAIDKKKDGDLAIPPQEINLPKPQPKLLWQKGVDQWHVDAAVDLVGDKVIAASAYVAEDKAGKCILECLKAADGATIWETPLELNPWGGPTVAGDLVLVGCSNIRFDKKLLPQAKGQIVAAELATGKIRWKKDLPGGVLCPLAVSGNLAVFTATNGLVYAIDSATGAEKWSYDAKTPFFAGVAISGGVVYASDLKGTVHALQLADGKLAWAFNVTADPAVASPAMVFSSPVVHGGEVFLATNRLEGEQSDQPLSVVCLSDQGGAGLASATAKITVDKVKKTITVPARIAPRELAYLKGVIYPLEVVACWPHPLGQKAHETVVNFDARPSDIHKALVDLGLKPGAPAVGEGRAAIGPEVDIYLVIPGLDGKPRSLPLEKAMADPRTGKPIPKLKWIFTGSIMRQPDPDKPTLVYGADLTGTLISIVPVTDETVFQTNLTMKEEPLLKLEDNVNILPPEGTPVELVIQVK